MKAINLFSALIVTFLLPTTIFAASFDCSKAKTKTEKIICANPELSRLDKSLSRAYLVVQKRFGRAAVRDQRWWLIHLRDECDDERSLKDIYEWRIRELETSKYRPRGTGAGKNASSYFSETPVRSIDDEIEGCFANQKCASYAEPLIPRYVRKYSIELEDEDKQEEHRVRKTLENCLSDDQRSMNLCVNFELFVLENEFEDVLSDAIMPAGERCEIAMEKRQLIWGKKAFAKCSREADEFVGGGTAYGGVLNACMCGRYRQRIKALRSLGVCKPCSKCLSLP
jgi:uncharacterized protein